MTRSLAFALEHAAPRHERLHVAGYSWGGLVGFNVRRALGGRGGKLIMISALTDIGPDDKARAFLGGYVRDYPNVFGPFDAAIGPAAGDLRSVRDRFNPMTLALRKRPAINELLILHGSDDAEVAVEQSRRFAAAAGVGCVEFADDHIYTRHWDEMLSRVAAFAPPLRYHETPPISREEAEAAFATGDQWKTCDALVRLALNHPDGPWVEGLCLTYARHADWTLRALAATCLGHLARIHGELDKPRVIAALDELSKDPRTAGQANDARDDIKMYIP